MRAAVCLLVLGLGCAAAKRDYYKVLEVERAATRQDVRKAFRRQALRFHPDKNPGKDTTKQFREVAEAYEVLGDVDKRRQYDQQGHGAWGGAGDTGYRPGNFDFDDLFKDFDDDFFKEMGVDLKGHFASHFGTHKANFEATGGEFDLNDVDFKEMFRETFSSMTGGGKEAETGQRCRTVKVKKGNTETVTTQCETVTKTKEQLGDREGARIDEL
jgi:molecular chaperone DnaJ